MRPGYIALVALITTLFSVHPGATGAPAQPGSSTTRPAARPATALARGPSFLPQFDASHTTLLYLPDPLPNVQRVLTDPRLGRLWSQGKLTAFIRKNVPAVSLPDLQAVWMMVLRNARWVPQELAVGFTEKSWEQMDHLVRLILYANLGAAVQGPEMRNSRAELQAGLAESIRLANLPAMRLWVRFRAKEDSDALFALVSEQLQNVAARSPVLKVRAEAARVTVSFAMSDAMPTQEQRVNLLVGMRLAASPREPGARQVAEALGKVTVTASLERQGTGLRLTFGDAAAGANAAAGAVGGGAGKPLAAADLGPLAQLDDRTIVFTTWDVKKLVEASAKWIEIADAWSEKLGDEQLAKAPQGANMITSMRMLGVQMAASAATGTSRVSSTGDGVEFRVLQKGLDPAVPLADAPLAKLIPAGAGGFAAYMDASMAEVVYASLVQLEMRAEQRATREATGRRPTRAGDLGAQQMLEAYREHFGPLEAFVGGDALEWFKPGVAVVYGSQGVVRRLEVRPQGEKPFIGQNLPMFELATMGVPVSPEKGREYYEKAYGHLVNGFVAVVNEHRDPAKPAFAAPQGAQTKQADLGLGVPAHVFDIEWLKPMASEVQFTVEGDLRPHYFEHGGAMVFSTSPRLSKAMIEAARSGNSVALPPKPAITIGQQDAGKLVGFGQFKGAMGVAVFDAGAVWAESIMKQLAPTTQPAAPEDAAAADHPPKPEPTAGEIGNLIRGIGEYVGLIKASSWEAWQNEGIRVMNGKMTFGK